MEVGMSISVKMQQYALGSSFIRKMFEEGARLKSEYGEANVFDFSLGNPDIAPPPEVLQTMCEEASSMFHGYMPNAGYMDVRQRVAEYATGEYEVKLIPEDIIMTCGAGAGMNVVLKSIIDPDDEIIAIAPYFVEYRFYAENYGGKLVSVSCDDTFLPDIDCIRSSITERTKAIIINSPNNPSGRVYPEEILAGFSKMLENYPRIMLISDEPYRRLVYDNRKVPSVLKLIPNSVVVTSASKDLSLAGQRIGYIVLGPGIENKDNLANALIMANRILGFVNAPALMQRILARCIHMSIDVNIYARRRDALCAMMDSAGLEYAPPEGAFYLFVKSPIPDDVEFCSVLQKEKILAVPGTGFGYPGYVRFAYCCEEDKIKAAGPGLLHALRSL